MVLISFAKVKKNVNNMPQLFLSAKPEAIPNNRCRCSYHTVILATTTPKVKIIYDHKMNDNINMDSTIAGSMNACS